jgi:DNA-binding GntR family transcriptional regulator
VEIAAFRGARVRRPSKDEMLEAYVVRAELEGLAVRLAMPTLDAKGLAQLERRMVDMLAAARRGDTVAEAAADAAFHGEIVALAGNATLQRVWSRLEPHSRTYITMALPGGDRQRMAELHGPILDALRTGDAAIAEAAVRHHFELARASLAERWVDVPDASDDSAD